MAEKEHIDSMNVSLCQECGGRCCQGSPGVWSDPQRFFDLFFAGQQMTLDQLRQQLPELGLVLWEKSGVPIPAPRSLLSGCAFLGDDGCQLTVAERPCQCLALIPDKATLDEQEGCCCRLPADFSFDACRQRWQEYWQALNR